MITLKKMMVCIIAIIALSIFCSGCVNASETESYVPLQPTIVPLKFNASQEPDSGVEFQNVTDFLNYWNARMDWRLSQEKMSDYSIKVENEILTNLKTTDGKRFHIKNLTRFDEELGALIGLSDAQISAFIIENQNQLEIDHMNYHKPYQSQKTELLSSITPGSQSAPYAHGKLFYLYIFTDFSIPSSYGTWTQEHMDDAEFDAGSGTWQIQEQAPSSANVINSGAKGHVTVTGQNFGDNITTWGPDGWMERAAQQFEYGQFGPYDRATENLAYNLKRTYTAGSVVLVFLTHDDKGATAIGPNQGYADKVLVSYWGLSFISEPGSYEHEIVHAYGALDEYQGKGNGISCNYWPSGLAVSPMYEMYKNSNYDTCPSSTKRGVMYYPYNDPINLYWWELSQASRSWIGWGDFDGDGELDPLDSTPFGNGGSKIGVFRNGLWVIDSNGNFAWDGGIDQSLNFGSAGDTLVYGDWNGNNRTKIGVFNNGSWLIDYNGNGVYDGPVIDRAASFGSPGQKPVVGDWNGDHNDEIGTEKDGFWALDYNGNFAWDGEVIDRFAAFGQADDNPVVGDWNGDGRTKIGSEKDGFWAVDYNGNYVWDYPLDKFAGFGQANDNPVVGDWNGDHKDKIGSQKDGFWAVDYNGNFVWDGEITDRFAGLGQADDTPVTGDWNSDGSDEIGSFANGFWAIDYNGNYQWDGVLADRFAAFGGTGSLPVDGNW